MKKKIVNWLGLLLVLSILVAACSGTTPTPQLGEEPQHQESVVAEESKSKTPRTGDIAPDFTLPDSVGNMVSLADELNNNRLVILVFYHAYS